jgi:hypothetical protein
MRGPRPFCQLPGPWNRCSITSMGSCTATAILRAAACVCRVRRRRTARRKSPEVRREPWETLWVIDDRNAHADWP